MTPKLWYNQMHDALVKDGLNIIENGIRMWFKNGILHREDGPAVNCQTAIEFGTKMERFTGTMDQPWNL